MILPNKLTTIESGTFYACFNLTSVVLPSTLTSIGRVAFDGCHKLTSVTFPEGLTSIGNAAFSGCILLTSIALPSTLLSIGEYAFSGCGPLNTVWIREDAVLMPELGHRALPRNVRILKSSAEERSAKKRKFDNRLQLSALKFGELRF